MRKLFQATCLAVAAMSVSVSAQAFTVEGMSAWSSANQPLRMDIELAGLAVSYASEVQVRVASDAEHERLGLTRPSWANAVRFQMISLPNYRVVARASTATAISDDPVSFVVEIRTPSEARLQQVGSALGLAAIADINPAPERTVTPAPNRTRSPVAVVEPAPRAKPYVPREEAVSSAPAAKAVSSTTPVAAASSPEATPAMVGDDRAALEAGLVAAKAQVADLEARLAALAAAEASSADSHASVEDTVNAMLSADEATTETAEAQALAPAVDDADNSQALAAATAVSDDSIAPVQATPLKPYELFARVMVLFVILILLVFFLLDKIRNRR